MNTGRVATVCFSKRPLLAAPGSGVLAVSC